MGFGISFHFFGIPIPNWKKIYIYIYIILLIIRKLFEPFIVLDLIWAVDLFLGLISNFTHFTSLPPFPFVPLSALSSCRLPCSVVVSSPWASLTTQSSSSLSGRRLQPLEPPHLVWHDAFKNKQKASQQNIHLEKAAVLFNLGAVYSQIGLSYDRTTVYRRRQASHAFIAAAGALAFLRDKHAGCLRQDLEAGEDCIVLVWLITDWVLIV